jgi:hypothetical protein
VFPSIHSFSFRLAVDAAIVYAIVVDVLLARQFIMELTGDDNRVLHSNDAPRIISIILLGFTMIVLADPEGMHMIVTFCYAYCASVSSSTDLFRIHETIQNIVLYLLSLLKNR